MVGAPRLPRLVGALFLSLAAAGIGLIVTAAGPALAGPGSPALKVAPTIPDDDPTPIVDPGQVQRLSIPYSPEEQGVESTIPQVPVADPTYIFVNMDGTDLVCQGGDDATVDSSIIACQYGFSGAYPDYGGTAAQRQSVMDAVTQDWAPFNMVVSDSRPNASGYTMCMTGPGDHPFGSNVLGIAPLDCQDANASNVVFAFHDASQLSGSFGANTQATTISQEVAHAYGLEHVSNTSDIMNPYNSGGNPSFTDTCLTLVDGGNGIYCSSQHTQYCSSSLQNSYQELLGMFGAAEVDSQAPSVSLTYPSEGEVFGVGADFLITCSASDDQAVASVVLWVNGDQVGSKASAPFEWNVTDIPEGDYDAYCVATDTSSNSAMSAVVSFSATAGSSGDTTTTGGEESGDEGGSTGGGDSADSGDSGGSTGGDDEGGSNDEIGTDSLDGGDDFGSGLPPGFGQGGDFEGGCACRSGLPPSERGWLLLGLLVLPMLRRRR
ncbi:Ig-like domain-containing protein [Pseudenhygromyxa sp. WMMC2535]|uniref:Ig-like domain-containing protein n=1 Tax=Pseudenhygromyxa sp. WMMC2535 TaxID=2712867 RepID=UPI0015957015|nr:Ig-like domain-containing protein [Pseudenhygromyxa sp. WMMC2535]NVB38514.1 Ig-like domain-containing protein [Pseudenhygromyxa sp. WMMC2535]